MRTRHGSAGNISVNESQTSVLITKGANSSENTVVPEDMPSNPVVDGPVHVTSHTSSINTSDHAISSISKPSNVFTTSSSSNQGLSASVSVNTHAVAQVNAKQDKLDGNNYYFHADPTIEANNQILANAAAINRNILSQSSNINKHFEFKAKTLTPAHPVAVTSPTTSNPLSTETMSSNNSNKRKRILPIKLPTSNGPSTEENREVKRVRGRPQIRPSMTLLSAPVTSYPPNDSKLLNIPKFSYSVSMPKVSSFSFPSTDQISPIEKTNENKVVKEGQRGLAKAPVPPSIAANLVLQKLSTEDPLTVNQLSNLMPDCNKDSIQAIVDTLNVFGLIHPLKLAQRNTDDKSSNANGNSSSSASGSTSSQASATHYCLTGKKPISHRYINPNKQEAFFMLLRGFNYS